MTLRLSALFENKVDELSLNFYRHRTGTGRRTRQRSRRTVLDEPGPSGISSPARRTTPRVRPEMVPRASARASTSRRHDDEEGPSTSDGLRMKISLSRGSVLSTSGLEHTDRGSGSSVGTSSRLQDNHLDSAAQRTRTRSTTRASFRESVSSTSSLVSDTPATSSQNGPFRYSTRSRAPPPRLKLNGLTADHESEDDDEDEEEEEEEVSDETEDETSEESDSSQPRSKKKTVNRKNSSGKSSRDKGKQVVNSKRSVRTRASSRYEDSASESDDSSSNQMLDISSRGRVRRKAFKMMDYVN